MQKSALVLALACTSAVALNPTSKRVTSTARVTIAKSAATVAASLVLLTPNVAFAGVCDYAPTSDLCVAERKKEALKPKAAGAKGAKPAANSFGNTGASFLPAAKPAGPPPVKLTKEAQAVADAEATISKLDASKKAAQSAFDAQKAKVDAMQEAKDLAQAGKRVEAAKNEYDSAVPRLKSQLPQMKEVRDKKAKKDKFVAGNKAKREKKERDAKAAVKKIEDKKKAEEKAKKEKKAKSGGASWSPLTGLF